MAGGEECVPEVCWDHQAETSHRLSPQDGLTSTENGAVGTGGSFLVSAKRDDGGHHPPSASSLPHMWVAGHGDTEAWGPH